MISLKFLILAIIFVVTSGALFSNHFRKNKIIYSLSIIVSIVGSAYLMEKIYSDIGGIVNESSKKEELFWESIERCGTNECYQLYLNKYPQGSFSNIAKMQIKSGHIEHYIVYDNGTVFDTKKNLLWMRCSLGELWEDSTCWNVPERFTWNEAIKQTTTFAKHSDWRLPTIEELESLIYCSNGQPDYFSMGKDTAKDDYGCMGSDHKKPTILQSVFSSHSRYVGYWSSTLFSNKEAWIINLYTGSRQSQNYKASYAMEYVRLVRNGQ